MTENENVEEDVKEEAQEQEQEDPIKKLEEERDQEKDRALRAMAELENYRRRSQQEIESFKKYAAEKVISEFLPVLDSYALACEHAGDTKDKTVEGFLLIQKQFESTLEKLNITVIDAVDQPFDPNLHQAIQQEKAEGKDSGVVLKEVQKGYKLHDRVIRPSMVIVSE